MTDSPRELAIFPLGSVLFPGMPLPLRVFEPRYVAMIASVLGNAEREFGVVLIERGSEVGGGDVRFRIGTVARVISVERSDESIMVVSTGRARFEVLSWLPDDPFPRALVRQLPPLAFDPATPAEITRAEAIVRATIARASEFIELRWPADIELSSDPVQRIWQVAGIAPLGALDQYALLRSPTATGLLTRLVADTQAADVLFTSGWSGELPDEDGDSPA